MEYTWLECLIYGLFSGFTELLPISSVAHQSLFSILVGAPDHGWLRFSAHLGCFLALLISFAPILTRLRRERKIAKLPKSRRRRQPDFGALMELRLLRTAAVSMLLVFLGWGLVQQLHQRLWLLALLLGINGILLYIPQYLPGANKSAVSMSALDGVLIGLASGFGIVPGISRVGFGTSAAMLRGADRRYAGDLGLMLCIPAMAVMMVLDIAAGVGAVSFSGLLVFGCAAAAAASFAASCLAVYLVRFLAVKVGFSGFAYYCWGLALFTLIIYLI